METLPTLGVLAGGYLIGAISPARIIMRRVRPRAPVGEKTEVRLAGSERAMHLHTVSASSVSVKLGSRYGFLTYLLDVFKVFVPTLAVKRIWPAEPYFLLLALAAMIGHIWPVYYRFRGGRGISAVYGALFAIDWIGVFATSLPGMLIGLAVLRDMLMAYVLGVLFVIPWLWLRTQDPIYLAYAGMSAAVFLVAMVPEIREWRRIKKERGWDETTQVMQLSGMGRGLLRAARWLRIVKPGR